MEKTGITFRGPRAGEGSSIRLACVKRAASDVKCAADIPFSREPGSNFSFRYAPNSRGPTLPLESIAILAPIRAGPEEQSHTSRSRSPAECSYLSESSLHLCIPLHTHEKLPSFSPISIDSESTPPYKGKALLLVFLLLSVECLAYQSYYVSTYYVYYTHNKMELTRRTHSNLHYLNPSVADHPERPAEHHVQVLPPWESGQWSSTLKAHDLKTAI
uniref:Uncharacterized protein n=1 Tax=Picea glauca TaxID=3330 RepID=A0A124GN81_PICGL|nr:hypothetical protein ABT39_MTgene4973 [Picea glauca]QHR86601.1 hypothetical protein Q903MT_gene604 [Picea sitchensis]